MAHIEYQHYNCYGDVDPYHLFLENQCDYIVWYTIILAVYGVEDI